MEFSDLIKENSVPIELIKESEGYQDGPRWVDGQTTHYLLEAAVFHLTTEDIKQYDGGSYTTKDIKLYIIEDFTAVNKETGQEEEVSIEKEEEIIFRGDHYSLEEFQDQTINSDFYEFVAKRVVIDD
ncbi:hypothetical protein [Orenia marismortui]|uniref:Uncharacterized protein n=1 Tax=Orenia marismortui TaxID=46469 RepID=A0A4R8H006_9FIRM|nr:hypothetical protein [Orenia marismortui]TDX48277.1 hypothetical protein C7959_1304 [Orenia marismortui]